MPRIYARAVVPRKPFPNKREAERILKEAAMQVARIAIKYLEEYTASWEHKPQWGIRIKVNLDKEIIVYIYPTGPDAQIFKLVSGGTKGPYPIDPKVTIRGQKRLGQAYLVFKVGYQPKTRPGGRYKGPGKAVGPEVFATHVEHPGIKPRNIEKTIGQWLRKRKDVQKIMKNAMARTKRVIAVT